MVCYRPQPALQPFDRSTGKYASPLIQYPLSRDAQGVREFASLNSMAKDKRLRGRSFRYLTLPCGLCFGCRCDNTRMWSLRMMHESRYHEHCYFITLTYAPEFLPKDGDLNYRDLRLFFVNGRHHFQIPGFPFKYFACGEYGDRNLRPHYHFAAFDFVLDDLRPLHGALRGQYFLSDHLRQVWGKGHVVAVS